MSSSKRSPGLSAAADLRLATNAKPHGRRLFWIIENGVRFTGMPAFATAGDHNGHGGALETVELVHLVRHLPPSPQWNALKWSATIRKGPDERAEEQEKTIF